MDTLCVVRGLRVLGSGALSLNTSVLPRAAGELVFLHNYLNIIKSMRKNLHQLVQILLHSFFFLLRTHYGKPEYTYHHKNITVIRVGQTISSVTSVCYCKKYQCQINARPYQLYEYLLALIGLSGILRKLCSVRTIIRKINL